ncbi:hypothetical protein [Comamonas sp.]|uniref:hypothetical protein n=1 Tax=Comamonas sp. TaxID=34028 RepID=UPI003A934EA8
MALDYLDFDYSEGEEGTGTWDAMACVKAERVPALAAEIEQLLRWAQQSFAGRQGAVDDGFDWDYDLQAQDDDGASLPARFDAASGRLQLATAAPGRTTVNLSISGSQQFGDALREAFELDS